MRAVVKSEPLACTQYVSAADPDTLVELQRIENGVLLSLAVRIGKTRLIDNILISKKLNKNIWNFEYRTRCLKPQKRGYRCGHN